MSINFESLKLAQPGLFGVRLCGSVGRAEKERLREFTAKCLANGKLHLILDMTELEAVGGGAAALIAGFQRDLTARGGEAVFVGVNDVVRRFLTLQFGDIPFRNFPTVGDAETALAASRVGTSQPTGGAEATGPEATAAAVPAGPAPAATVGGDADGPPAEPGTPHSDRALDMLLDSFATRAGSATRPAAEPVAADGAGETVPGRVRNKEREAVPSAGPVAAGAGGASRPRFVPLDSALQALRDAPDAAAMAGPLRDLLHSFDLAGEVTFCVRQGDALVDPDSGAAFPAAGRLAAALAAAERPLSLLDAGELDLAEGEIRLLAELRADMVLPVLRDGALVAAAVVRRGGEGREYGVSDTFALSLLARWLATPGASADAEAVPVAPSPEAAGAGTPAGAGAAGRDLPAELRRKVVQMQALFSLSEDFARVRDGARLMDLLCVTVTAQLGVRAVAVLELEGDLLTPRICRGIEIEQVPPLAPFGAQMQGWFAEQPLPVPVEELPPLLHRFQGPLAQAGFTFVAPLRTRGQLLGVLLLGGSVRGSRPDLDLDFLSTLLNQAAIAMDNARMLQQTHEQNIGVIRTLVSLIEQRHQAGSSVTERVSGLVAEVAREMSFPTEKMRDLVYGTVLRDIGMIPISDLVLRSPRKLTENEWKQVKGHPETGVELLGPLQLPPTIHEVVLCHHERFNGEGYPRGLQGRAIPLSARIVAVVESYVAMVSELPYRTALSDAEAISILNENWGMRYDPDIVEAFLRVLAREDRSTRRDPSPVDAERPVEAAV